jgi:hypothetical protein
LTRQNLSQVPSSRAPNFSALAGEEEQFGTTLNFVLPIKTNFDKKKKIIIIIFFF